MTVKELITQLQPLPQDAEIYISNKFVESGMFPTSVNYWPPDKDETPTVHISTYLCE